MGVVLLRSQAQAAATGQAVMEGAVASLAQQDPSRFARLSARLQPDHGPAAGAAARARQAPKVVQLQHQPPSSRPAHSDQPPGQASSGASSGAAANVGASAWARAWQAAHEGDGATAQAAREMMFAGAERLARCLSLADDFAPVQRGFALVLELCDSLALANAVGRCMAARLERGLTALLDAWPSPSSPSSSDNGNALSPPSAPFGRPSVQQQRLLHERLSAAMTLSTYLSYLTHAHQSPTASAAAAGLEGPPPPAAAASTSHPPAQAGEGRCPAAAAELHVPWPAATACAPRLLQQAAERGMLPLVLPCVAHLLGHAHRDAAVLAACSAGGGASTGGAAAAARDALRALCALRQHRDLQPGAAGFAVAAHAVRALVDATLSRFSAASTPGLTVHQLQQLLLPPTPPSALDAAQCQWTGWRSAALGLAAWDQAVDPWLLELCCPTLDSRCQQLQREVAAAAATHASVLRLHSVSSAHGAVTPSRAAAAVARHPFLGQCASSAAAAPDALPGLLTPTRSHSGVSASTTAATTPGRPAAPPPRKVSAIRLDPPPPPHAPPQGHAADAATALLSQPAALLPPAWAALLRLTTAHGTAAPAEQTAAPPTPGDAESSGGGGAAPPPPPAVALQLQRALVAQYSGDEQPVRLRDVVAVVSDLLAANACALALDEAVRPAALAALQQLQEEAQARAAALLLPPPGAPPTAPLHPDLGGGGTVSAAAAPQATIAASGIDGLAAAAAALQVPEPRQQQAAQREGQALLFTAAQLEACVRQLQREAVGGVAVRASRRALAAAERVCGAHVRAAAAAALRALLPPAWPAAVRACAATLAEQAALVACAQRLSQQASHTVGSRVPCHLDCRTSSKGLGQQRRALFCLAVPGDHLRRCRAWCCPPCSSSWRAWPRQRSSRPPPPPRRARRHRTGSRRPLCSSCSSSSATGLRIGPRTPRAWRGSRAPPLPASSEAAAT